jgi:hypothetical protein
MPDEDRKRAAYRALVDSVLKGNGRASAELREQAFRNERVEGLPPPLDALVDTVTRRPAQTDFTAAKAAGYSEDQLFELVICAAIGQSARLYEAGLAELERLDNAS